MTKRYIYIAAIEKNVTIGQYTQAVKTAKSNLNKQFKHGLTCWWPCTGQDIMNQFMAGVQDRISQAIPYDMRGLETKTG